LRNHAESSIHTVNTKIWQGVWLVGLVR
jgi:hypothetical protein